jgi:hypothetical protein
VLLFAPLWAPILFLTVAGDAPLVGVWRVVFLLIAVPFTVTLVLGLALIVALPTELWETARSAGRVAASLATRPWQRAIEDQLLQQGRVAADWYKHNPLRQQAARSLLAQDAGLVEQDGDLRLLGAAPIDCPSCGAVLRAIGPGLRRCGHCDHQRYDPPPLVSPVFLRLRMPHRRSWREQLLTDHPDLPTQLRHGGLAWLAHLVGLGLFLSLHEADLPDPLLFPAALVAMLAPFAVVWHLGRAAHGVVLSTRDRWVQATRAQHALRDEIARQVGDAGALPIDTLAARLGLPEPTVTAAVASLLATGELPIAYDHTGERLVSRLCPNTDTRCEGCGSGLRPEPRGLVCTSCDRVHLAIQRSAPTLSAAPVALAPGEVLALTLDRSTAAPGEPLTGQVQVQFGGPRRCEGVRLRLLRELAGHGDQDDVDVMDELVVLRHAEVLDAAAARFSLTVPCDSVSYAGPVLQVRWWVHARLLVDDLVRTHDVVIVPATAPPPDLADHREQLHHARARERWADRFWVYLVGGGLILLPCALLYLGAVLHGLRATLAGEWTAAATSGVFCLLVGAGASDLLRGPAERLLTRIRIRGRLAAPRSALLGEVLHPTLHPRAPTDAVRWELSHVERTGERVQRQVSGRSQQTVAWRATRVVHASGDWPEQGGPRVQVPAEGPATVISELRQIDWELRVFVRRGGWRREIGVGVEVMPCRVGP